MTTPELEFVIFSCQPAGWAEGCGRMMTFGSKCPFLEVKTFDRALAEQL
jgi:hypothetical protein